MAAEIKAKFDLELKKTAQKSWRRNFFEIEKIFNKSENGKLKLNDCYK